MKTIRLESAGEARDVRLEDGVALLDSARHAFREIRRGDALVALEVAGEFVAVRTALDGDRAFVRCGKAVFEVRRLDAVRDRRRSPGAAHESHTGLVAPMPGRVRRTLVGRGEEVAKGQVVIVLEAMKMEHAIRAPRAGLVTRIEHREGDLVESGEVLAEIADT